MKTLEVEIEVMKHLGIRQNIVVPNVFWGMGLNYEADIVSLTSSNYATEVEIKVSRGDLLADKKKKHYHDSNLFKYLYYAVPKELEELALKEIPSRAGLLVVRAGKVVVVRKAEKNNSCVQWKPRQRSKLAHLGCMRILKLKEKLNRKLK